MAEFVVGQWVECDGAILRVTKIGEGIVGMESENGRWKTNRIIDGLDIKPFAWQVWRKYRTTLEGVTATIKSLSSSSVSADASDKHGTVCFHLCTGKLLGMESREDQPHLLPFLADEPSEPEAVKPQASSPYDRVIGSVEVDLWTLADIYGITSHRLFSAWKKITMAGRRGPKDKLRDLKEARVAIDKEIAKLEAEGGAE